MGKITAFNFISLDGYYEASPGDISWHQHDAEGNKFSEEMLAANNTLLFGRVTYELMVSYWPTPYALENDPIVAAGMNKAEKIVFSQTLKETSWNNTSLMKHNILEEIKSLKQKDGKNMAILGSGSIITQFAQAGLIDEYQLLIDPIAIGGGTSIFRGIKNKLPLKLKKTKVFKNGSVLLCYEPATE